MKTMTCRELGGACDKEFHASTFEEIAEQSKKHGGAMFQTGEPAHLKAMNQMQALMESPEAMGEWFADKRAKFDALPDND